MSRRNRVSWIRPRARAQISPTNWSASVSACRCPASMACSTVRRKRGAPAHHLAQQQVAQRPLAVVQLEGAGAVDATGARLDVAHAHDPALHDFVQPRQALGQLHGRHEHVGQEAPAELLDHGLLQGLARTHAREDAALGQADPVGHRLQGDRLQSFRGREVDPGADNGGAGEFALGGLGVHGTEYSTIVRNRCQSAFLEPRFGNLAPMAAPNIPQIRLYQNWLRDDARPFVRQLRRAVALVGDATCRPSGKASGTTSICARPRRTRPCWPSDRMPGAQVVPGRAVQLRAAGVPPRGRRRMRRALPPSSAATKRASSAS